MMPEFNIAQLSEAIGLWTGFESFSWPHRDDARVLEHFGDSLGNELLRAVHALETDFYASDARLYATGISDMAHRAIADFKANHPEVSDKAVEALAWCYTYDYK